MKKSVIENSFISLFLVACASPTPPPAQPTTNYLIEHQQQQCADFVQEYETALRWCETSQNISEGSRQASCQTARAWERDCTQTGTDTGVQDAGPADGGIDADTSVPE